MKKDINKIQQILNKLYELHECQLESFDKESLPDLEKQSSEREIEVDKLKRSVSKFLKKIEGKNKDDVKLMLIMLNEQIPVLLEQNKALQDKIYTLKNDLKLKMKQISKGKKVISSYRSAPAAFPRSKVISITN